MKQKRTPFTTWSFPFFALLFASCATTPRPAGPEISREVQYVVQIEGKEEKEIYDGLKLWVAENFASAKAVIDYDDPENGILICNGVLPNITLESGMTSIALSASFKMKAEVKDGRARLTFNHFKMTNRTSDFMYQTEIDQIRSQLKEFGSDIKRYMLNADSVDF